MSQSGGIQTSTSVGRWVHTRTFSEPLKLSKFAVRLIILQDCSLKMRHAWFLEEKLPCKERTSTVCYCKISFNVGLQVMGDVIACKSSAHFVFGIASGEIPKLPRFGTPYGPQQASSDQRESTFSVQDLACTAGTARSTQQSTWLQDTQPTRTFERLQNTCCGNQRYFRQDVHLCVSNLLYTRAHLAILFGLVQQPGCPSWSAGGLLKPSQTPCAPVVSTHPGSLPARFRAQ